MLLPDDHAARDWRSRVVEREICVFAPVHSARPAPLPSSATTHASHFVSAQPTATGLLAALLEDAHVVETLEDAQKLKGAQPQSVVATRNGELITRPGLVLVGQEAGATSLAVFTRQAELRQLESDLSDLAVIEGESDRVLESARATFTHRAAVLENARNAVQQGEVSLATVRQEERAAQMTAEEAGRQAGESAREIHRLSLQENADAERHEQLRAAIAEATTSLQEATTELDAKRNQLAELSTQEETKSHALTERRIELATQVQQCESHERQREPVAARVQELRELASQRRRESLEHEQRVAQAREEIAAAEGEQVAANEAQVAVTAQVEAAQVGRNAAQDKITEQESALRTLRREHTNIHDARSESEVKLAEQRLFLRNLREKFQRDYQKELEDLAALEEADATTDWPRARDRCRRQARSARRPRPGQPRGDHRVRRA